MPSGYGNSGYGDSGYGTDKIYEYPDVHNSISRSLHSSPLIEKTAALNPNFKTSAVTSATLSEQDNIAGPNVIGKAISNSSVTERIGKGIENVSNSNAIATGVSFSPRTGKRIKDAGIGTAIANSTSLSPKLGTATSNGTAISIPSVVTPELIVTLDRSVLEENYGAFINDLNMKDGDTHPPIRAELYGLTDEQFYYSDISVIVEHISNNEIVVNTAVDERNSITNKVSYYWNDDGSDLPYTGEYRVEFEITHPDGRTETFPPSRYLKFEVKEGLN